MTGLLSVAGSTPSEGFELTSCRFDDGDSAYLSRTPAVTGNQKTFTVSCWVKRGNLGATQNIITARYSGGTSGNRYAYLEFDSDDTLLVFGGDYSTSSTTQSFQKKTSALYRDVGAWYHVVWTHDTTEGVAADRDKIYVNGTQASWDSGFTYDLDADVNDITFFNITTSPNYIGQYNSSNYYDGYLAEFYFIDGSAPSASYFGETNAASGQWQPKEPKDIKEAVTFGNNGFYLPFSNDALADSFTDSSKAGEFPLSCDYLIVGGGGGGGSYYYAGGGGAGGFRTFSAQSLAKGAYTVVVGAGGTGDGGGGASSFNSSTSAGGGQGARDTTGGTGGSGGGGGSSSGNEVGGAGNTPSTSPSQGNDGGDAPYAGGNGAGGGGGGATAAGTDGNGGTGAGGAGGNGTVSTITGSSVTYAGGGGGGAGAAGGGNVGGSGGTGGGGDGGEYGGANPGVGTANTGGGGGGASGVGQSGALGGSGIVIIRYAADAPSAIGGTITSYTDSGTTYQVHSFTSTGSSTFSVGGHAITVNGDTKNIRVSNHSVAENGQAHIIGSSLTDQSSTIAFDGTTDAVTCPASSDWNFASTDFTIEAWVNPNSIAGSGGDTIVCRNSWGSGASRGWAVSIRNQKYIKFMYSTSGSAWATGSEGTKLLNLNRWYHVAVVRTGSTWVVYVDGILDSTWTDASALYDDSSGILEIGDCTAQTEALHGYINEVRISDVARYSGTSTTTANFTVPTTAFTSDSDTLLLVHSNTTMGSTTFTDSSSNSRTMTAVGNAMNVAPKIGVGMAVFDGSGDYVTLPDSPDWDLFASGSVFTLEAWIRFNTVPVDEVTYADFFTQMEDGSNGWRFGYDQSTDQGGGLWIWMKSGGSTVVDFSTYWGNSGGEIDDTDWHHVAMTKNGSDYLAWLDGVKVVDGSDASSDTFSAPLGLAGYSVTPLAQFDGCMDEVRITRSLKYTAASPPTPPTTAFTADKDTVLLLHMDGGGGIVDGAPTLPGEGTYFYDSSSNAIFYDSAGVPTNKSIINFDGTGDYLTVPSSSDFSFGTGSFTYEFWANLNTTSSGTDFFWDQRRNISTGIYILITTDNAINIGTSGFVASSDAAVPRDNTWHHIACVRNGSENITIYVDGTSVGTGTLSTDVDTSDVANYIGSGQAPPENPLNGKMDQVRISNIARYTSAFTPPTEPFTTDSNTKLLIQSDWSEGGLGADHSGNYNYFTPTNLTSDDMMEDSPMNNFCTMNSVFKSLYGTSTLSEGNLKYYSTGDNHSVGTIPVSSGKWYFEVYNVQLSQTSASGYGVLSADSNGNWLDGIEAHYQTNQPANRIYVDGSYTQTGITGAANGDIVGVAFNLDDDEIDFYVNNTQTGVTASLTSGYKNWIPYLQNGNSSSNKTFVINFGQDSSFAEYKTAQGNQDVNDRGDFFYTPPAGFLALCTDNLSAPSITKPTDHFESIIYTGTGSTRTISTNFQSDFSWFKRRSGAVENAISYNVSTGGTNGLRPNTTGAPSQFGDAVITFNTNNIQIAGTSVGGINGSSEDLVAWNWKAGGTAVTNTDGTNIDSEVSANPAAGFSICTYTGTGTNADSFGHGLSQAPELVVVKRTDTSAGWQVGSDYNTWAKYQEWDASAEASSSSIRWNDTAPTASVVTLGTTTNVNGDGATYLAYCWHSIDGYSKIGGYTGNGNADGPFIYTGFKPAYIWYKRTDVAANWRILDNARNTYNVVNKILTIDTTDAESTDNQVDFDSNGWKIRDDINPINVNNGTYLYYAVAETPFKTANAR